LVAVQGHVEAQFVARGYAVQSDLGAVSGGQASLYRRATIARTEMLRILSGLTPLRSDPDPQDVDAYRTLIRIAVERLVDEIGTPGGPRVEVVDSYFRSLTGKLELPPGTNADNVPAQLGALRERLGLTDGNVNTPDEEAVRTSFWTLVDLALDLQRSWFSQRGHFSGGAGQGFLGTELILLARLMEAAADQVDELEAVFDSVLIGKSERKTLLLATDTMLTLDDLLRWLRSYLGEEGRRIAQDTGRDGIVSALAPTVLDLFRSFERLSQMVDLQQTETTTEGHQLIVRRYLPASCCSPLPTGMYAARTRIAVASTCRLLKELVKRTQGIGRYPAPVLTNVLFRGIVGRTGIVEVEFRGFNMRPTFIPAFIKITSPGPSTAPSSGSAGSSSVEACSSLGDSGLDNFVKPLTDSATGADEALVGLFHMNELDTRTQGLITRATSGEQYISVSVPAEDLPVAVIDGERGTVIHAPETMTWPNLRLANDPLKLDAFTRWDRIPGDDAFSGVPTESLKVPDPVPPPPPRNGSGNGTARTAPSSAETAPTSLETGDAPHDVEPVKVTPARRTPPAGKMAAKKAAAKKTPSRRHNK
jgi:hypothetical protein